MGRGAAPSLPGPKSAAPAGLLPSGISGSQQAALSTAVHVFDVRDPLPGPPTPDVDQNRAPRSADPSIGLDSSLGALRLTSRMETPPLHRGREDSTPPPPSRRCTPPSSSHTAGGARGRRWRCGRGPRGCLTRPLTPSLRYGCTRHLSLSPVRPGAASGTILLQMKLTRAQRWSG